MKFERDVLRMAGFRTAADDDDDSSVGRNGRQRRSAAVEDDEFGVELDRETRALFDVRREDRTGEPASAPAATDRRDTGERCGFTDQRPGVVDPPQADGPEPAGV